jgi:hypothetical protein
MSSFKQEFSQPIKKILPEVLAGRHVRFPYTACWVYCGRLQTQMGMTNATNGTLYVGFEAALAIHWYPEVLIMSGRLSDWGAAACLRRPTASQRGQGAGSGR